MVCGRDMWARVRPQGITELVPYDGESATKQAEADLL